MHAGKNFAVLAAALVVSVVVNGLEEDFNAIAPGESDTVPNETVTEAEQPPIQPLIVDSDDAGITVKEVYEELEKAQRKMEERIKLLEVSSISFPF